MKTLEQIDRLQRIDQFIKTESTTVQKILQENLLSQ